MNTPDEPKFHLDFSEQDPELPKVHPDECSDCKVPAEFGYGMMGGGIGAYSYCPQCGKLLAKTQDSEA
jgi:hypothetical protein